MPTRVYVGLGSNLGNRTANIRAALDRLAELAWGEVVASAIYRTDPLAMEDDAEEFANAAAGFDTRLSPRDLLMALQQIEVDLGRPANHARYVSRTIDLDVISYGSEQIDEPGLVIPHPHAHERTFVLLPMLEIAPDLVIAGQSETIAMLLRRQLQANAGSDPVFVP